MKILLNTYPMAYQPPGGGEVIIDKIYDNLLALGIEVKKFNPFKDRIKEFDIVHHFSTLDWQVWRAYKEQGTSLVVTPTSWADNSTHNKIKLRTKHKIKGLISSHFQRHTLYEHLKYVDHFTPTTNLERDRFTDLYNISLNKTTVIPNGVDLSNSIDESKLRELVTFKEYFLFVGRISKIKNLDFLIKCFIKSGKNLVIIGDAKPGEDDYYKFCQSIAKKNILFLGAIQDSVLLNSAYRFATATVVPSIFETCSLVAMESLAAGTPVLITKNGGTQEVFQNFATYIDPYDSIGLLNKLNNFQCTISPSALQDFIKNNYSWKSITKSLINVYKDLYQRRLK